MALPFAIILAALVPSAFVKEIPDFIRTNEVISIAEARARLIANHGERIFFRTSGTIIANRLEPSSHFILLDSTAATDVLCSCDDKWQVGDEVTLICTAKQSTFVHPTLRSEALEITVHQHTTPSEPSFIHPADLIGHRNDFNSVCIEGTVIDAFKDDRNAQWTILVLEQDDVQTMVWVHTENLGAAPLARIIDSEIRITGIVLPDLSNFYRARGPWVLATSSDSIKITRPQPTDPFNATAPYPHRQIRSGRVLATWNDNSLFLLCDDGQRLRIHLVKGHPLPHAGDFVRVAGFLRHTEFCTRLSNAISLTDKTGNHHLEDPSVIPADKLLLGKFGERQVNAKLNGQTIRISGKVLEFRSYGAGKSSCLLGIGSTPITVWTLPGSQQPETGSIVEATGICILEESTDMDTGIVRAAEFALALRDENDLRVLVAPPWWTPTRFFVLIAALILSLLAILVWNAVLRKIIARRSRELIKETIRSASAALRLEERTRLAVELHDTIAQDLTGASFEIKTVSRLATLAPERMFSHLEIVDRTLKSCRDNIRNCIWDLRTNTLDQKDLNQAIRIALSPHTGNATLQVRFNILRSRISEPTLHALMRIVRELAINAVRHGHATDIKVAGSIDGHALLFSVRDNGCGFDPDNVPGPQQGHFGLQGIRERIRKLNGTLTIDSSIGHGTRVAAKLNLHALQISQKT